MSWSPQQEAAIKAVRQWLAAPNGPQVFRLFGFAGSGKTTLAKEIAGNVKGTVLFGAFTGKASLVLRKKGCPGASTIHSLIYKPIEDPETGKTVFKLNHDSAITLADLVIIDEVSMVDQDLALDLLSYRKKVLVLGDPAQLPPVKGEGYFINADPDVMLTEVHRQAAENPIIRMSMDVREGRPLKPGAYGDSQVLVRGQVDKEQMRELVLGADQLLCGMNKTRQTFNTRMRTLKGMLDGTAPNLPRPGDRLVCLKNNHDKGLLNGGLWEVIKSRDSGVHAAQMVVRSLDVEELEPADVIVPFQFFEGREKELDWRELKRVDQFTYGYALTVHKSQGSSWDNVMLFDESFIFREDRRKHLYTGLTRAAERITVVI
ncbi:ATP-dependent RecD-like DNA helicase [compost metagenome]